MEILGKLGKTPGKKLHVPLLKEKPISEIYMHDDECLDLAGVGLAGRIRVFHVHIRIVEENGGLTTHFLEKLSAASTGRWAWKTR